MITGVAFRLERRQLSIDLPDEAIGEFQQRFPNHILHNLGRCALGLVSFHEVRGMLSSSPHLSEIPTANVINSVLDNGVSSSRTQLELPLKSIKYLKGGAVNEKRKVVLMVDDSKGVLETEREGHFDKFRHLGAEFVPFSFFVPDITLAVTHAKSPDPKEKVIEFLAPFLPNKVKLEPVTVRPRYLQNPLYRSRV